MGGALGGIAKLAGPILQVASMFTPLGPIMQAVNMAMSFAKTIGGALKSMAPKAFGDIDKKLDSAQNFAQKAVGKAQDFLQKLGKGVQDVGQQAQQINFPPANPLAALGLPLF